MSKTVECTACGEQTKWHATDSGSCKLCGGECLELDSIYSDEGLHPDQEIGAKSA